ncbi:hypothetical protein ACFFU1_16780 [Algibacter miyuki]|uniref:Uncharacterized protein n=1 Tax=Algibacter miyuki TaxID=1306933 RepID=A0ABV5H3U2_9FLAO|nr:hypothetical protein [Algibacter miyuki]MDN3665635.1 hypothetical protein [Algibacter miyuki]
MSLLDERTKTANAIAEGRFIAQVLKDESTEIDKDVKSRMNAFASAFWSKRNFAVNTTTLTYTTLKKHRFVDMKTRQTENGVIKKKRHEIHNKPIFGHLNNIVRELSFGFTESVKEKFMKLQDS